MRLRLGLLQDVEKIEKQVAREAAEAQARKHKLEAPTVRTEADQKAYEQETAEEKKKLKEKAKPRINIRPLSEAKAIDTGANFVSESFLFLVGFGLIIFESWRRERKESNRREDVAERIGELEETEKTSKRALVELEKEILRLREKAGEGRPAKTRILPKELWEIESQEEEEKEKPRGWLSWLPRFGSKQVQELPHLLPTQSTTSLPDETDQSSQKAPKLKPVPVSGSNESKDSRNATTSSSEAPTTTDSSGKS